MQKAEYGKLLSLAGERISIGITPSGKPQKTVPIIWEGATQSFEMQPPGVYLTAKDLKNSEILSLLDATKVVGLYIWEPLEDYSFISHFKYLEDISIKSADALSNLNFLKGLDFCKMLYLQNANLENLNTIIEIKKQNKENFKLLSAVALDNCKVGDLSAFEEEEIIFIEFLIFEHKSVANKNLYKNISAARKRYYTYD